MPATPADKRLELTWPIIWRDDPSSTVATVRPAGPSGVCRQSRRCDHKSSEIEAQTPRRQGPNHENRAARPAIK